MICLARWIHCAVIRSPSISLRYRILGLSAPPIFSNTTSTYVSNSNELPSMMAIPTLSGSALGAAIAVPMILILSIIGLIVLFACRHKHKRTIRPAIERRPSRTVRAATPQEDDLEIGMYSQFDESPRRPTRISAFASPRIPRLHQAASSSYTSGIVKFGPASVAPDDFENSKTDFSASNFPPTCGASRISQVLTTLLPTIRKGSIHIRWGMRAYFSPDNFKPTASPIALPSPVILNDERYVSGSPRESRVWPARVEPDSPGLQAFAHGIMQSSIEEEYRAPIISSSRACTSPRTPSLASAGTLERIEEEHGVKEPVPPLSMRAVSFVSLHMRLYRDNKA